MRRDVLFLSGQRERIAQQQEKAAERAYTLDELRTGLRLMIKRNASKVGATVQIGHPSAASTLGRYARRLRRDGELLRNTPTETEVARLEAIDAYMYRACVTSIVGNVNSWYTPQTR